MYRHYSFFSSMMSFSGGNCWYLSSNWLKAKFWFFIRLQCLLHFLVKLWEFYEKMLAISLKDFAIYNWYVKSIRTMMSFMNWHNLVKFMKDIDEYEEKQKINISPEWKFFEFFKKLSGENGRAVWKMSFEWVDVWHNLKKKLSLTWHVSYIGLEW